MASVFDGPVQQDQQRADQLLELVKWASGLRGAQQLGRSYSGPIADIYNNTIGHPSMRPGGAVEQTLRTLPPSAPTAFAQGGQAVLSRLGAAGTGLGSTRSTGMFGADVFDQLLGKINKAGGSIAKKAQDAPDIQQAGQAAAAKLLQKKGATGPEALAKARSEMKHWTPGGTQGTGVRTADRLAVDKVVTKLGNVGDDKLLAELQTKDKSWTLDQLQRVKGNQGRQALSLDDPESTIAGGLKSIDNPELLASINQQVAQMSPSQQKTVQKLMAGEEVNPALVSRLRKSVETPKGGEWYQRAVAQRKAIEEAKAKMRPISGGSGPIEQTYSQMLRDEITRLEGGGIVHPKGTPMPITPPTEDPRRSYAVASGFKERLNSLISPQTWHGTGRGPGIEASGMLEARTGTTQGGLGGNSVPGVSLTQNPEDALETARMLVRAGRASRGEFDVNTLPLMARLDAVRKGVARPADIADEVIQGVEELTPFSQGVGGPIAKEYERGQMQLNALRNFYSARENVLGLQNPHIVAPLPGEWERALKSFGKITPESARVLKVSPDDIPNRTPFGYGTDPGEIRVSGDIPLRQSKSLKPDWRSLLGFGGLTTGVAANRPRPERPREEP